MVQFSRIVVRIAHSGKSLLNQTQATARAKTSPSQLTVHQLLDDLIKEHDEAIAKAEHIEELPVRNVYLRVHRSIRDKLNTRLLELG